MSANGCVMFASVLDLNAFERQNKAEGLGMVSEEGSSEYGFPWSPTALTVISADSYCHNASVFFDVYDECVCVYGGFVCWVCLQYKKQFEIHKAVLLYESKL